YLGEDELLTHPHRVIPSHVERLVGHPAEVSHARQGDRDETVNELIHALTPESDRYADGHPLPKAEAGNGFLGLGNHRMLSGDRRHVAGGGVERFGLSNRLTQSDVHRDLMEPRHLHDVRVVELTT